MEIVLSPITHKPAELIKAIPTSMIISLYQEEVQVDVKKYLEGLENIFIYKCRETGYRFYYPFNVAGDDIFYEQLQKFDWYYADWKWDYDAALPFISSGSKVLDIGCGSGNFLVRLKNDKNCECVGLEFNDKAIEAGRKKGLEMHREFIQDFAKEHKNEYDFVCFFQVLEHIADIDSFMKAAIECLKPGGKMLICVPNNNPYFLSHIEYNSMNMPPHHMGVWNKEAFEKMGSIYSLKSNTYRTEKLSRFRIYTKYYIIRKTENSPVKRAFMNFFKTFITGMFVINRKNIEAGSILWVYEK